MRYADGRPLWQISVALWPRSGGQPVPVLSWSPNNWRNVETVRDTVMLGVGTDEPWIMERGPSLTVNWRKPLTLEEVNCMAQTPEVRRREGRP